MTCELKQVIIRKDVFEKKYEGTIEIENLQGRFNFNLSQEQIQSILGITLDSLAGYVQDISDKVVTDLAGDQLEHQPAKHEFERVGEAGLYDDTYVCKHCNLQVTESADAPQPPEWHEACPGVKTTEDF